MVERRRVRTIRHGRLAVRKHLVVAALAGGIFAIGSLVAERSLAQSGLRPTCPAGYAPVEWVCIRQAGSDISSLLTRDIFPASRIAPCRAGYQDLYFLCFNPETGDIENVNLR